MRETTSREEELLELLRWIAQTVHQGYHTESGGTFMECKKSICESVAKEFNGKTD